MPPSDPSEPAPRRTDALGIRAPAAFRIEHPPSLGGVSLLVPRGELDLAAAATLRAHVRTVSGRGLVIDLSDVTFLDSSALRELLYAQKHLGEQGIRLVLAGLPRTVDRLLRMTGTLGMFEVAGSREDGLRRFG